MSGSGIHGTSDSSSPDLASVFSRTQRESLDTKHKLEMLEARRSNVTEEQALKVIDQLSLLKMKQRPRQAEWEALKSKMSFVQDKCCKFEKANTEVSTRIADLTTRIVQHKAAELHKINNIREHVQDLQHTLAETISSPECRDRLVASLTAQWKELKAGFINLDSELQCTEEAELREAKDERVTLGEANDALKVFEVGQASLERTLAALTEWKQQLEDECEQLSREA